MDMSPVLKTSVSDGSGVFFHAFSESVYEPYIPSPSKPVDLDDYVVSVLLSRFFAAENPYAALNNGKPFIRSIPLSNVVEIDSAGQLAIGAVISSITDPSHSNTVSLACFDEVLLRRFIVNGFSGSGGGVPDQQALTLMDLIRDTPIDQLDRVLSEALTASSGGNAEFELKILKDPKLTISRLTQSDFSAVRNQWFGTPEMPFFDAFDLVKERVTRQESSLNSTGYAPAVYTDNGGDGSNDTIVFKAGYGMTQKITSLT
ncbi:hypothetical protein [Psychrobacter sp. PAMC 21119]|uniref:hypothetical protein n=1 Tax=Psychrobacter sp. PAMC 21119 TaxID=1112209 RepID=UPI000288AD3B|nr:hypothetical protein [Psychrobacter sp. PAMC 21119]